MYGLGLLLFCEIKKGRVLIEVHPYVLSFASGLSKVRKMRSFFAIACAYKVTSRGLKPLVNQT